MLNRIRKGLEELGISTYTLQGDTPKERRAQLVKGFNSGGAQVFLISLKAGGTGLNLTAAALIMGAEANGALLAMESGRKQGPRGPSAGAAAPNKEKNRQ